MIFVWFCIARVCLAFFEMGKQLIYENFMRGGHSRLIKVYIAFHVFFDEGNHSKSTQTLTSQVYRIILFQLIISSFNSKFSFLWHPSPLQNGQPGHAGRDQRCESFSPNKCVHMLTVSVCTRKMDLKHAQNECNGGRWPSCKKSLSCSHWGSARKWQFFHTLRTNSSAALWAKAPIPDSLLVISVSLVWNQ